MAHENESLFVFRVAFVVYDSTKGIGEDGSRFFEGDSMLGQVGSRLLRRPLESQRHRSPAIPEYLEPRTGA